MRLKINERHSPQYWTTTILNKAKRRSGGIVEQQLVGAKLVYHVTAAPSRNVLSKCAENLRMGLHPILLVPSEHETKTKVLAQDEGIDRDLMIVSIEDFVALNIIEPATEENKDFFSVLKEIVEIYNQRLAEVETDLSLQIDVH